MEKQLSEPEKLFIRENFNGLYNNIQTQQLIDSLIKKKQVLKEQDIASLTDSNMKDDKKLVYIIFNILMRRGTCKDVQCIKQCLVETGQQEAIRYFPDMIIEEEEEEEDHVENQTDGDNAGDEVDGLLGKTLNHIQRITVSENNDIVRAAGKSSFFTDEKIAAPTVSSEDDDLSDSDCEVVRTAGKGSTSSASTAVRKSSTGGMFSGTWGKIKEKASPYLSKRKKTKHKSGDSGQSGSDSDRFDGRNVIEDDDDIKRESALRTGKKPPTIFRRIDSFTDAFIHYETKDKNSQFGHGLCLIISLFTGDLTGYIKDRSNIIQFFSGLNYDIKSYENLTKDEMFEKIEETQRYIEYKGTFDRLAVVVLTHGKEDGLLTCADDSGVVEEMIQVVDSGGNETHIPVKTKVEEIVSCFKHDKIPSLKGMPKFFLIQACRGSEVVKAAGPRGSQISEVEMPDDNGIDLSFKDKSPIDADVIVCSATTEDHPSMVNPHTGSWFIQKTIKVFQKHYDSQHVLDMMTVVNLSVAELRGKLQQDDGRYQLALQIPCIVSTLRRQFFLDNPAIRYTLHHSMSDTNLTRSVRRNLDNGSSLFR